MHEYSNKHNFHTLFSLRYRYNFFDLYRLYLIISKMNSMYACELAKRGGQWIHCTSTVPIVPNTL